MFRWFPATKRDRFTVKSRLLLLGSPYFYKDETTYVFGKNEDARFHYLFKLMMNIHNDLLNHIVAQNKNTHSEQFVKHLRLISVSMSRLMRHVEVLHSGLDSLSREQFQKYVLDINETLSILEEVDTDAVDQLNVKPTKILVEETDSTQKGDASVVN